MKKMNKSPVLRFFSAVVLLFVASSAFADKDGKKTDFNLLGSGTVFKLDPLTDGILLGSGLVLSGTDLLLDNILEVNRQEYTAGTFYNKNDVNSIDKKFMHSYSEKKDKLADLALIATIATPAVLLSTDKSEWFTEAMMFAETLLLANGTKEMLKLAVNRTRPYMYYDSEGWPQKDVDEGDFANSFPSGHSTIAFASATFATYTFWKYNSESALRFVVLGGSYALASSTAVLRLMSGNHFLTDVMTGAAIGTAFGFLVPWLHTFNTNHDLNVALLGNGVSFRLNL